MQLSLVVGFFLVVIVVWGREFLEERSVRSALNSRGVETEALIVSRIVKACFGLRCSDPVYFRGGRGDPGFEQFNSKHCGQGIGRGSRENCWYYLRLTFVATGRRVSVTKSVSKIRNQELKPGHGLTVRFDPHNVANVKVVNDGQGDPEYYAFMFVGGVILFFLWLGFGLWINARRERRGWGTGYYRQGY